VFAQPEVQQSGVEPLHTGPPWEVEVPQAHFPLLHFSPTPQTTPHVPQFFLSELWSTQPAVEKGQQLGVDGEDAQTAPLPVLPALTPHVHTPPKQTSSLPQAVLHAPQFLGSELISAQ